MTKARKRLVASMKDGWTLCSRSEIRKGFAVPRVWLQRDGDEPVKVSYRVFLALYGREIVSDLIAKDKDGNRIGTWKLAEWV